jgi:UDP-N-acetyl-D-glucosamine dehydrogenase
MTQYQLIRDKIQNNTALVGIIGLGYVGLPLAHALHQGGLPVLGFDIDQSKIDALKQGRNYLIHLGDEMTQDLAKSGRFSATTDFARLGECDAVIVCVPTPLGKHQEPDLSYVLKAGESIGKCLRAGQLISLESTTYPRTTRDEFLPEIMANAPEKSKGLKSGEDFFVLFSPEREDPGRKSHTTSTIPKLVGGLDDRATELGVMLYAKGVAQIVPVENAEVAESAKLLENIFRSVNIALVNEMKTVLQEMDIDIWDVVKAASTKPFGFMPFYPGPGLGGHCIPIDPYYLTWKAKEVGRQTRFIELAGEVNSSMPHYVISRLTLALNEHGKAVKGSKVLVVGLSYKPDIDDTRESPSFELIHLLRNLGAQVSYHDPYIPRTVAVRKHDLGMTSVEMTPANIAAFDTVLISTNHSTIDFGAIAQHAKLAVDTRNALAPFAAKMGARLWKA